MTGGSTTCWPGIFGHPCGGMWEDYTTPPLAAISSGGMSNYRGKYVTVGPVIYGVSMFIELIYNFVFIYINIYSIEMYYLISIPSMYYQDRCIL